MKSRLARRSLVSLALVLGFSSLAQADVTRAYLVTLGWEGAEVERFLEGPSGKKRV